jgi:hypothetical protein
MKISIITFSFVVFTSFFVYAEEKSMHDIEVKAKHRAETSKPRNPYLVDLKLDKSIEVTDPEKLLPNRLYKRYDVDAKGWVFDLTNIEGEFRYDPELGGCALGLNSTIPGEWAGGPQNVRYRFNGPDVTRGGWEEKKITVDEPGFFYLESTRQTFNKKKYFHSIKKEDL